MRHSPILLLLLVSTAAVSAQWAIEDIDVSSRRSADNPEDTVLFPGERNVRFTFQGPAPAWNNAVNDVRFLITEIDPKGVNRDSIFPESRVTTIPIGDNLRVAWTLDLPATEVVSQVPHAVCDPENSTCHRPPGGGDGDPQTLSDTIRVIERLDITPIIVANGIEVGRLPVVSFAVQQPPQLTITPTQLPLGAQQVFQVSIPSTFPSFADSESLHVFLFHPQDLDIGDFGDAETVPLDGCVDNSELFFCLSRLVNSHTVEVIANINQPPPTQIDPDPPSRAGPYDVYVTWVEGEGTERIFWRSFALNGFTLTDGEGPGPGPEEQEITGVLDAAGFEASISPGAIVSVFGNFAEEEDVADSIPLPFDLGGFSVTFDEKPAALFGVFAGAFDQANVQVPWDVDVSDDQVEVKVHWRDATSEVWSEPFEVAAAQASPGIYMFPPGTTQAIVTNFHIPGDDVIEGSWAQAAGSVDPIVGQPAAIGGVIVIWGNGLGPVIPEPLTGALPPGDFPIPTKTVRVTIGGQEAQVLAALLHPASVGLSQINVIVPEGVAPGDNVPIIIEVDCGDDIVLRSRDDVTIAVRSAP